MSGTARRWLVVALVAYAAALAVALLAPTSGTQSSMASVFVRMGTAVGLSPETATQARAEFLGNALILVPVAALGSLVWRGTTWREWTAYAFVLATAVELTQGLLLSARTASASDVVANTLGGLGGAVLVAAARWGLAARERRQELDRAPGLHED
jgi:glycopeptide antibiotics resistance protein